MKRLLLVCMCLALTSAVSAQSARMDLDAFGRIVRHGREILIPPLASAMRKPTMTTPSGGAPLGVYDER